MMPVHIPLGPATFVPPPAGNWNFGRLVNDSWPLDGDVSSEFGAWEQWRRDAGLGPHRAVDIAATRGTTIFAPADARVSGITEWDGKPERPPHGPVRVDGDYSTRGWAITLDHHGRALQTGYLHLNTRPLVEVGENVVRGQPIASVGNTGWSTGPHLHWTAISWVERAGGGLPLYTILNPLDLIRDEAPVGAIKRIGLAMSILQKKAAVFDRTTRAELEEYHVERPR